jgi:hypothetical protein
LEEAKMLRRLLPILVVLCGLLMQREALASHFRYGSVTWRVPDPAQPLTVEFNVTTGWRQNAQANQKQTQLDFGDGSPLNTLLPLIVGPNLQGFVGSGVDTAGNPYDIYSYTTQHTYASAGQFTAFISNCCRVAGIINTNNTTGFVLQTVVDLSNGNTGGPVAAAPAIIQLQNAGVRTYDFPAFDPDADAISCRLATVAESGIVNNPAVPNGGAQPSFSVFGNSCRMTWDLTKALGGQQYSFAIVMESTHAGQVSSTGVDLIVEISDTPVPTCTGTGVFTAPVGAAFSTQTTASTQAQPSTLKFAALSAPAAATFNPAIGTSGPSPFTDTFSWTPALADAGKTFIVSMNYTDLINRTATCFLTIQVPQCANYGAPCSVGVGECVRTGTNVCQGMNTVCSVSPGAPSPEICDGKDNNCDGANDNVAANQCCQDDACGGAMSGQVCNLPANNPGACVPGCRGMGGNGCPNGLFCTSTTNAIGQCVECIVDADCTGGKWCDESTNSCQAKLTNGSAIPVDAPHMGPILDGTCTPDAALLVCLSAVCDPKDNLCGLADGDGPCTMQNGPVICRAGVCNAMGTCGAAPGCKSDSDCIMTEWCNEAIATCELRLPNGDHIPTDPMHMNPTLNGKCTPQAGLLTCESGVCDTKDDLCGYADGDGPCNMANGIIVCRSGACSANGTCLAAMTCNVDADCMNGNWCDESVHLCTPKLPNGSKVPVDAPHMNPTLDGNCTPAAGALVCQAGVCDVTDNGCGYANGEGPCTPANQSQVCRSGLCATSGPNLGLCVGCLKDADCPMGVCDTQNNFCVQCWSGNDAACKGQTPVCDSSSTTCLPCDGDFGQGTKDACSKMDSPFCFGPGPMQGACGKCTMDADCKGHPSGELCDTMSGACVKGCMTDMECGNATSGLVCDDNTHKCEMGCRGKMGNGCPTGKVCTSKDTTIGMCVECAVDSDCGGMNSGKVCDMSVCVTGCRGMNGNGCPTGELCSSSTDTLGVCQPTGTTSSSSSSSSGGDAIVAQGNGLLCAMRSGDTESENNTAPVVLLALAASAAFLRRKKVGLFA